MMAAPMPAVRAEKREARGAAGIVRLSRAAVKHAAMGL